MADKTDTIYGVICEIVRQETLYLRHYIGEVLSQSDEINIGMIQVSIPELGWVDGDTAPWCYPRQHHSMSVPEVGEWVEVYFLSGDQNKPVYMGVCNEMRRPDGSRCVPSWFAGDSNVRVIHQSPKTKKGIRLNDTSGEMLIDAGTLTLIEKSTEPFVLGNKLNTWLSNFINSIFNTHTHVFTGSVSGSTCSGTTNTPLPTGSTPTDILSSKIQGQ